MKVPDKITVDLEIKTKFSWSHFLIKLTSRKFLATLSVQAASIVALFKPELADSVSTGIVQGGAILAMLLSAIFYTLGEAKVDAARVKEEDPTETGRVKIEKSKEV